LRVTSFIEKPQSPPLVPGRNTCFASMGNYIFSAKRLIEVLKKGKKLYKDLDFGKHIIPMMLEGGDRVFAYSFFDNSIPEMEPNERGYWKDVGTIDTYYEANMDLVSVTPECNLYSHNWPVHTVYSPFPPSKMVFSGGHDGKRIGMVLDSIICGGAIVSGGRVVRSIVSPNVRVNSYAEVEDSILMEAVEIGRNCRIRNTIIDKYVKIPSGTVIGFDAEEDANRFDISPGGIVAVPKNTMFD